MDRKVIYVAKWICRKCNRNSDCTECQYYEKFLEQSKKEDVVDRKVIYVAKWICRKCNRNSDCTECQYYEKFLKQESKKED